MTTEDVYKLVAKVKPRLIYVSGKTSTGKSTFAKRLATELDYAIIELDQVVLSVKEQLPKLPGEKDFFIEVYRNREEHKAIAALVKAARKQIENYWLEDRPVVIEGAIAHPETLAELLDGYQDFIFVYFHPNDLKRYVHNLTARFMQSSEHSDGGLGKLFWKTIDPDQFKLFCETREVPEPIAKAIEQFAMESQLESDARLNEFVQKFNDIVIVGV